MTDTDDVLIERDGDVQIVTINRPENMNSLNDGVHAGLHQAWDEARADRHIRAIVITAAGSKAFCTGMDLREAVGRGGKPRHVEPDVRKANRLTPIQNDIWLPVITAVNGVCAAAGLHFVADADVVLASDTASFLDTHVFVGQVSAIEPIGLLHRIGLGNTLSMVLLGRSGRLSAADALRVSLVNEVTTPENLLSRALELAHVAASASPDTVEQTKRAIWGALELPYTEALQAGWDRLTGHRTHPDFFEGPRAFVEKRTAEWTVSS